MEKATGSQSISLNIFSYGRRVASLATRRTNDFKKSRWHCIDIINDKYRFIERYQKSFSLGGMCHALEVSRSGYYAWKHRPESLKVQEDRQIVGKIRSIHTGKKKVYGSPRVHQELREQGIHCSVHRVARLMKKPGIRSKVIPRFRVTTDSNHSYLVAPNLLIRDFKVAQANRGWASDLTDILTEEGWLYLAVILDLYSRKIVGWAMEDTMETELMLRALKQAVGQRHPKPGLIHHSDRESQYASYDYQRALKKYRMRCSMSRKGDCYDNAVVESFFHTLKGELVHDESYSNRAEAKLSIFEYIEGFYNRERKHSYLNFQSPEAFEKAA